ncbi:MAG TPA: proline/glycine betaine ABC transporter permease [Dehalococcoidia bacterium]|nr:proline/glycine betaine ABC transporter permease [Dehalococcoidia bacterium]
MFEFPEVLFIALGDWINTAIHWLTNNLAPLFDALATGIRWFLVHIKQTLLWLPWWAIIVATAALAWRITGWKVAVFSAIALFFIGTLGLWDYAMVTLAIIVTATIISIAIGIPTGILAAKSDRFEGFLRPQLDAMQTMPSFVYLIPAVFFFGLGMVPAVVATVIYAVPPCIRLTNLGIRQVSREVIEAGHVFGCTPRQLLTKIQLPLALPSIMAGVNQTIMMALAMVIICSMIGAGGLGLEVLRGIERLDVGRGFTAGISIVLAAIIIDRISAGVARTREPRLKVGG